MQSMGISAMKGKQGLLKLISTKQNKTQNYLVFHVYSQPERSIVLQFF